MSSSRFTTVRVLRLRVKDKHTVWLCGLAREVNTVFNYCNELSVKVFEREQRFLSGFDSWPFLKGGDIAGLQKESLSPEGEEDVKFSILFAARSRPRGSGYETVH